MRGAHRLGRGHLDLPRARRLHRSAARRPAATRSSRVGGDRIEVAGSGRTRRRQPGLRPRMELAEKAGHRPADLRIQSRLPGVRLSADGGQDLAAQRRRRPIPGTAAAFQVRIEGRVLGWERVRVPAGEFDALKIERRVYIGYWESTRRGQSVIQESSGTPRRSNGRSSARPWPHICSYVGENTSDSGFLRVADSDQSGGPSFCGTTGWSTSWRALRGADPAG